MSHEKKFLTRLLGLCDFFFFFFLDAVGITLFPADAACLRGQRRFPLTNPLILLGAEGCGETQDQCPSPALVSVNPRV